MASSDTLSFDEIEAAGLADWRPLFEALRTRFRTGDFATGLALVNRIGELAEAANHHPDVDLARQISAAAAELDVPAEPTATSVVEIALDTWDAVEIKPFWKAVLGMGDHPHADVELRDLDGSLPTLWFQETEEHAEPEKRFHLDVRVPPEVAPERVAAAIAAGGRLVTDEFEPRFTVLADPQGNLACVTTGRGRD